MITILNGVGNQASQPDSSILETQDLTMRIQRLIHFVLSGLSPISRFAVRSAERVTKANIVFILADDLGYGDLKCYNAQSKISKPNLDQHAESSSVCMPTDRRHRKQSAIVASCLVSLLCLVSASSSGAETIEFTTTYLKMSVDGTGGLSTLEDRASGVNYLPKEQPAPLLMLYRDSEAIAPKAMEFDRAHSLISLMYQASPADIEKVRRVVGDQLPQ